MNTLENYSLSKKVFCAECQSSMWKMSYALAHGRYNYLCCRMVKISENKCCNTSSIRLDYLENTMLAEINKLLDSYYNADLITIEKQPQEKSRKEELQSEMQELISQIDRGQQHLIKVYEDKLNEVISEEQFSVMNKKFQAEIANLKKRLEFIKSQLQTAEFSQQKDIDRTEVLNKYKQITEINKLIVDEFIKSVSVGAVKTDGTREINIKWAL
ncbi:MAG: zinc ribbon domain-containing protein [Bacteroidales bacterium]|nr:zinc ribbon domain-containing protein [Bacteroidales bacterium]